MEKTGICPFRGKKVGGAQGEEPQINHWWPTRLKVEVLSKKSKAPYDDRGDDFDYKEAIKQLNYDELKKDIKSFLRSSVDWWPSDYGHYGPQMVRMAWHSAGTYRIADGRGGAGEGLQRFAPLNSWWDNGNIDKSRRLLLPIKQKYGKQVSWADLIVLTGTLALEDMGLPIQGFAFGRIDAWDTDHATYWGPEGWMGKSPDEIPPQVKKGHPEEMVNRDLRWTGKVGDKNYDLENPLAASHQSLIYVDPEGPNGNGNPLDAAKDIRETFARMGMNDEETVALTAGGHAFGKSHGAHGTEKIGAAPEGAAMSEMGLGWNNPNGKGHSEDTVTNGIEGSWTPNPTKWDNDYLVNLFKYEWEKTQSPAGSIQWRPVDKNAPKTPDAHKKDQMNELMMMTTDIAFKEDPEYRKVCEKFLDDFDYFTEAFSKAWHKLMHRDMGPKSRYLGPDVGADFIWQDPLPTNDVQNKKNHEIDSATLKSAKKMLLELPRRDLIALAWASASTYRDSDKRGGANGARIALEPMNKWEINRNSLNALEDVKKIKDKLNDQVSLADLIVLGGTCSVEEAAKNAGHNIEIPFYSGRVDATSDLTDSENMNYLQPVTCGFRNYHRDDIEFRLKPEHYFLDKASLLGLDKFEWTALTGGLRVLDQNYDRSKKGVLTDRVGTLSNDFFKTICSMDYKWKSIDNENQFEIVDRKTNKVKYVAGRCDLIFGSNTELRQISEMYSSQDGEEIFMKVFVKAWSKVMMLDRFDINHVRKEFM